MRSPLVALLLLSQIGACAHDVQAGADRTRLKVMTYNLWAWRRPSDSSLTLIETQMPDILVAQEVTGPWKRRLLERLGPHYPYHRIRASGAYGYAIFSRYPLDKAVYRAVDGAPVYAQCAPVQIDGRSVRLCNLHLKSPVSSFKRGANMSDTLERNESMRRKQWKDLRAWLQRVAPDAPHILAGDTNSPGFDDLNNRIAEHYVDAHAAATVWTDSSFPNQPLPKSSWASWLPAVPFLRLDYVWVSRHFAVVSAGVVDGGDSDHLPVVVELDLPPAAQLDHPVHGRQTSSSR